MSVMGEKYLLEKEKELGIKGQNINPASVDLDIGNQIKVITFGGYKERNAPLILTGNEGDNNPYSGVGVDAKNFEAVINVQDIDLDQYPEGLYINPRVGVLLTTRSVIRMPKGCVGTVVLKSSKGREFYQHIMAGYVDNGFEGQLTLELYAPVVPILLKTGMRIVQLRFDSVSHVGRKYGDPGVGSHYQGQVGPTLSWEMK